MMSLSARSPITNADINHTLSAHKTGTLSSNQITQKLTPILSGADASDLTLVTLEYGHSSHAGLCRDQNEDCYHADAELGLWLVADGMGGHEHGEIASALARASIVRDIADGRALSAAIVSASEAIIRSNSERNSRRPMGTTVVALTLKKGDEYEIAWLGDSRVYMFNGELKQLSRDHSFVQECLDRGLLTPEQARASSRRNLVTQALGVTASEKLQVKTASGMVKAGMQFLLCSDGLTEEVNNNNIADILARGLTAQESVDQLIQAALDGGGSDNVTVVLLKFS